MNKVANYIRGNWYWLVYLLAASLLLVGNSGRMSMQADNYTVMGLNTDEFLQGRTYEDLTRGRFFLTLGYRYFEALMGSMEGCVLMGTILHILAGALLFQVLYKRTGRAGALMAALLFMGYCGKSEILTAYCASIYPIVGLMLVLTVCVYLEVKPLLWRSFFIGYIIWLSLHLYEVLVPLLPAYMFLIWRAGRRENCGPVKHVLAQAVLIILPIIHFFILNACDQPLWHRAYGDPAYVSTPIYVRVMFGFWSAISRTFGFFGWNEILVNLPPLFKCYIFAHPWLLVILTATAGSFLYFINSETGADCQAPVRKWETGELVFLGFWLVLFGGTLTFVLGMGPAPSRMTLAPSLGLALLLASLIHFLVLHSRLWKSKVGWWLTRGFIVFAGLYLIFETAALSSILQQNLDTAGYDRKLTSQIHDYFPNANRSTKFVVFIQPPLRQYQYWKRGLSTYLSGSALPDLWFAYQTRLNDLFYVRVLLKGKNVFHPEGQPLQLHELENVENVDSEIDGFNANTVGFIVDDAGLVRPLRSVHIVGMHEKFFSFQPDIVDKNALFDLVINDTSSAK